MTRTDAHTLARAINVSRLPNVGHAWVNPSLARNGSTVSVRCAHGVEFEWAICGPDWRRILKEACPRCMAGEGITALARGR